MSVSSHGRQDTVVVVDVAESQATAKGTTTTSTTRLLERAKRLALANAHPCIRSVLREVALVALQQSLSISTTTTGNDDDDDDEDSGSDQSPRRLVQVHDNALERAQTLCHQVALAWIEELTQDGHVMLANLLQD